ncbi:MAG: hypothetical protein LAQ69_36985 [Acidobacteriia bacterium]|nr:hypothetical protein [Terriglobia bacterium]
MVRRFFVCLLLCLAAGAQQLPFRIFTTQDGLVRNWVVKIYRDSKIYLWFCTVEGISLFDGGRFTNYGTRDGLPARAVADMLETRGGDYWFATAGGGLARFRPGRRDSPRFESVRLGDGLRSNTVNALLEDHEGTIWCGTDGGLFRFRPLQRALARSWWRWTRPAGLK